MHVLDQLPQGLYSMYGLQIAITLHTTLVTATSASGNGASLWDTIDHQQIRCTLKGSFRGQQSMDLLSSAQDVSNNALQTAQSLLSIAHKHPNDLSTRLR